MHRHAISDEHWERIEDFLPGQAGDPGVTAKDNRLFVNAVLWIGKTGAPGATCPSGSASRTRSGGGSSLVRQGRLARGLRGLKDPDLEWLILDSTVIRAHQHAAVAAKKRLCSESRPESRFDVQDHPVIFNAPSPTRDSRGGRCG